MSFYKFTPKTEEELEAGEVMEPGLYPFRVAKSTPKESEKGNMMANLQLIVWGSDGKPNTVFDLLIFSEANMCIKKISHFCKATGINDCYERGEMPEDLEGLTGDCYIGIQEATPKKGGGTYARRNIVDDYHIPTKEEQKKKAAAAPFIDDEIDF